MTRLRKGFALALVLVGAAAAFVAAAGLHDALTRPVYDFLPISGSDPLTTASIAEALPELPPSTAPDEASLDPCLATSEGEPALPNKLIVIGWDGADWRLILPLLQSGRMPHLEQLLRRGTHGTLDSFLPSISPALWTSVATGLTPEEHGIHGFYARQPRLARWWERLKNAGQLDRRLYTNADREARAIWNILDEAGKSTMVVGYHNTFPVEQIDGVMVSNYLVQESMAGLMDMQSGVEDREAAAALVHPVTALEKVLEIQQEVESEASLRDAIRRFADVPDELLSDYLDSAKSLPRSGDQRPWFLTHAWAIDEMHARIAEALYAETEPDVLLLHFQAVDWAAHHFLYFHWPERYQEIGWSAAERRALEALEPLYRRTVDAYYLWIDARLGRLLELVDEHTGIVLLSDHGVGIGEDPGVPGFHDDGPPGIVVLAGPGIRAGAKVEGATLYDILPTLLAALDLPLAEDLPGQPMAEAFCEQAWSMRSAQPVPTYTAEDDYRPIAASSSQARDEVLDQLEALGYVED